MARRPFVSIIGPSGGNLVIRLGDALISVKIVDQAGAKSDTLEFTVRIHHPFPAGPPEGTRYVVNIGWSQEGARLAGIYTVQTTSIGGDAEDGYEMKVTCRAADFIDTMKKVDSDFFDDETVGSIFSRIAGDAGMVAVVDPELAAIKIPYRLRHNQSAVDFLDDLAGENGGTLKLAGGKLLCMKRGGRRSAGGTPFPPIVIPFDQDYGFEVSIESRGAFKDLGGDWFDPDEGILKLADDEGIGEASRFLPVHPFASEDEAKRGAAAAGREQARKRITGSFDMAGNPLATAEAPVQPQGYGPEIDGLDIVCSSATHTVTFDENGGWVTTVEVESAGDAKAKKRKGGSGGLPDLGDPGWQVPPGGENAPE